ncbi:MAG: glycoside hydrolase family 127 protein [Kiritimatiellae bacterium]|nr:glycoside hydrolase family 127 protein [Kiritimatiellia bacterium]
MTANNDCPENAVRDALSPPAPGCARLLGPAGEAAGVCLRVRAFSDWAQGPLYDEAARAFRTHWDDDPRGGQGWGWQNEYWGKTMLGFAGAIRATRDPALAAWALDKAHAFVREFQKPNGYLSTYASEDLLRRNPDGPDPRDHACFNVWGRKYTLWALVELHEATGDAACLAAAEKMADHLAAQLGRLGLTLDRTGTWHGVSSMSILRPLLELHRLTGSASARALAESVVRAASAGSGSPAAILRDALRPEPIAEWHPDPSFWAKGYEIMSCLEGFADWYRLTGERRVLDAVLAYERHLVEEELNPMGSVGCFDHFLHAAHRVNGMTELCDVVHWIRLERELLLLTGDPARADRIEEAFLNAFLAGVWRDGRWGAHIVRSHGTRHLSAPPQVGMALHQCCPDNMVRAFFDYAGSQAARAADGALCVLLYTDGAAALGGDRVEISGGYPWSDGPVVVRAELEKAGTVRFRAPRWSAEVRVDGEPCAPSGGWIERPARAGTNVWRLGFDLSPRLVNWTGRSDEDIRDYVRSFMEYRSKTPEMAGLVREEAGVRVLRGPLVLAKGRLAGTSREETLFAATIRNQGWRASLHPAPRTAANAAVPQPWTLLLERAGESRAIPVADFASVSDVDDPSSWFSLWF